MQELCIVLKLFLFKMWKIIKMRFHVFIDLLKLSNKMPYLKKQELLIMNLVLQPNKNNRY